jgi:iron complex outermembrane receptor protein
VTNFNSSVRKAGLLAGSATVAAFMSLTAAPAFAQDAAAAPAAAAPTAQDQATDTAPTPDIVVTGTLFRNASAATASPVTVLTSNDLANRGINTVADAVQSLSANNGGTLNSNWSQFGFPKGASAPSLRGLTDGRTLTLFDGLRSAPYPLADDGYRNFVDINTIPDSIVDRVEVLQDGASSTYGADAVAGVVNVIVKKEVSGLHLNASNGISQRGDAAEHRVDGTFGYGKLSEQGFNVYVNGEYQTNDPLFLRDRSGLSGTADQSSTCGPSIGTFDANGNVLIAKGTRTCRTNGIANGIQFDGTYGGLATTIVPFVRPYNAAGTAPIGGSTYQMLNPAAGCQSLQPYTLTAAQHSNNNGNAGASAPATVCQQDTRAIYYQYQGKIDRIGANAHLTVNVGSRATAYAMFNFYETKTYNPLTPQAFANQTAAGGTQVTISPVLLPIYVCAARVNCTAANGTLNPNNPFASQGQQARLVGSYDRPTEDDTVARTFRYTAGISGSFGDDWNYALDATHSDVYLRYTSKNYIFAQHLLDVLADGSYNFVNQSLNTEAQRQYLAPTQVTNSVSRLTLVQGSISHGFFTLPGGPFQIAVGASYRKESINNPSSNPANEVNPFARYYGINAVGVQGSRSVKSAYYEIDAPVFDQLHLKATGRYDDYSSGQKNFSPKFEAEIRPIHEIKLRGTYSKGFAIPSFNEAFGLPTTGYINTQVTNAAFIAAHGNDSYVNGGYSYGLTAVGNPAVKPEKSTSYTLGVVVDPLPWLTVTVDYYNIKVKNLITTPACSAAVTQYYANNGVTNVPGCVTAPGVPDTLFPNALPLLGSITSVYTNANSLKTRGIDFTANARIPLGGGIKLNSNFNATLLLYLAKINNDGSVERYDNTLGPCEITSCSGSPRFKGSWQNTLDFNGKATLSTTINYTSGYQLEGADDGGIPGDCLNSIGAEVVSFRDNATPVACHAKRFIDVDMAGSVKVADKFTLYVNILNLFDVKPPYDPSAGYSLYQFNPAWAGAGFIGRYFRVGAKVDF